MTPKTNHTPGPWEAYFVAGEPVTGVVQSGRAQDEWRIDGPKGCNGVSIVASVHGPDMEANASLIAAAPDLLNALEHILEEMNGIEEAKLTHSELKVIYWAKDAIAKAEGSK